MSGPLEELVSRIEKLVQVPTDSPLVPVALGVCDVSHVRILEMPTVMETNWDHKIRSKNSDQKR